MEEIYLPFYYVNFHVSQCNYYFSTQALLLYCKFLSSRWILLLLHCRKRFINVFFKSYTTQLNKAQMMSCL